METDWMKRGNCHPDNNSPREFVASAGTTNGKAAELNRAAKVVCNTGPCPVLDECLDYALRSRIDYGVYGGTTEGERRKMVKAQSETPVNVTPLYRNR